MILSIIVPIHNEEKTLELLLEKVIDLKLPEKIRKEIILIDDKSTDNSQKIITKYSQKYSNISAIINKENKGKSQSVKSGVLKSTGDWVIVQDADLEYTPSEIRDLLIKALDENLDVVYGNRFGKDNKVIYWRFFLGNKFLSLFSNLFTYPRLKTWIPDMEVCYKLIKGKIFRRIAKDLESTSTFGLEPEITAKLSKYKINGQNLKFGIVPISYRPRTKSEGKHIEVVNDGIKAFYEIIKFNLK